MNAVEEVLEAGGDSVPELMDRVEERMAALSAGHGALLARYAGDTIAAGGKRLRPLLVCLAAGVPPPKSDGLVRAAVAVELVHAATLVHDDVLDGSSLRRGRPTVVSVGGRRVATATGDLLFSRAFSELAGSGSVVAGADPFAASLGAGRRGTDAARGCVRSRGDHCGPLSRPLPLSDRGSVPGGVRARGLRLPATGDFFVVLYAGGPPPPLRRADRRSPSRFSTTSSTSPGPPERTGKPARPISSTGRSRCF